MKGKAHANCRKRHGSLGTTVVFSHESMTLELVKDLTIVISDMIEYLPRLATTCSRNMHYSFNHQTALSFCIAKTQTPLKAKEREDIHPSLLQVTLIVVLYGINQKHSVSDLNLCISRRTYPKLLPRNPNILLSHKRFTNIREVVF